MAPSLGLEYVTEYFNPEDSRAHPMYICSLEGCKSSWGTSDDMFHHVTNTKHLGNVQRKNCFSEETFVEIVFSILCDL